MWAALHSGVNIPLADKISTSGLFNETSKDFVKNKLDIVGLDNVVLIDGPFIETMTTAKYPIKIMAAILDCDLYQSYKDAFNYIWPNLEVGGMIHLDEYYSLKFPGARLATDEFIRDKKAKLEMCEQKKGDFERWHLYKC